MSAEESSETCEPPERAVRCCGRLTVCDGLRTARVAEQVAGRHGLTSYVERLEYCPLDVYVPGTGLVPRTFPDTVLGSVLTRLAAGDTGNFAGYSGTAPSA